jgi:hypothetical protein
MTIPSSIVRKAMLWRRRNCDLQALLRASDGRDHVGVGTRTTRCGAALACSVQIREASS